MNRNTVLFLLVSGLALFVRLVFITETKDLVQFQHPTPGLDIDLHWQAAKLMREDSVQTPFELMIPSAPLYPALLAAGQALLGESYLYLRIVSAMFASLIAGLVFLGARRLVQNELFALAAAGFWILTPSIIYFDSMLFKSSLEVLLLAAIVFVLLVLYFDRDRERSAGFYPGCGILLSACLVALLLSQQGTLLYFLVVVAFLGLLVDVPVRSRVLAIAPVVLAVGVALFWFQNRQDLKEDPFAATFWPQAGIHMRIGFQQNANGTYADLKPVPPFPFGHVFVARMNAANLSGRELTPSEADVFYRGEALGFMREHPGESLLLLFKKFLLFCNNFEPKGIDYLDQLREVSMVLRVPLLGYGILLVLGFAGGIQLARRRLWLPLLLLAGIWCTVLAANLLTFVSWRYRFNSVLPLVLLSGPGLELLREFWRSINAKRNLDESIDRSLDENVDRNMDGTATKTVLRQLAFRRLAFALAFLAVGLLAFWPVFSEGRPGLLKRARENRVLSEQARALKAFLVRNTQDLETRPGDTDLLEERLVALDRLRRFSAAFPLAAQLAPQNPDRPRVQSLYLRYLAWLGRTDTIRAHWALLGARQPNIQAKLLNEMVPVDRKYIERVLR